MSHYRSICNFLYYDSLGPVKLMERLAVYGVIIPLVLFLLPIFYDPKEAHRSLETEKISLSQIIRKFIIKKTEQVKNIHRSIIDKDVETSQVFSSIEKRTFAPLII